jgi:hypothetical protein
MASATVWPHATPPAIAADDSSSAIAVNDAVPRASRVCCWFGANTPPWRYSLARMTYADCTAAARADAFAGPAGSTWMAE